MGSVEDTKLGDLDEAWKERELEAKVLKQAGHDSMALALRIYCVEIRLKTVICQVLKLEFLPKLCKTHDLNVLIEFTGLWRELNDPDNSGIKKTGMKSRNLAKLVPVACGISLETFRPLRTFRSLRTHSTTHNAEFGHGYQD